MDNTKRLFRGPSESSCWTPGLRLDVASPVHLPRLTSGTYVHQSLPVVRADRFLSCCQLSSVSATIILPSLPSIFPYLSLFLPCSFLLSLLMLCVPCLHFQPLWFPHLSLSSVFLTSPSFSCPVLVLCCYNRLFETEWLIKIRSHRYGGWEVWDQGVGIWFSSLCFFVPHGRKQKGKPASYLKWYSWVFKSGPLNIITVAPAGFWRRLSFNMNFEEVKNIQTIVPFFLT